MCPDPQILSVYMDEELPSPWKEKMEAHLTECSACREKLNRFRQLTCKQDVDAEQKMIEAAKNRVWQNLQSRRRFQPHSGGIRRSGVWQRRLSIPMPAAAAAAIVIMLLTAVWLRDGQVSNDGIASQQINAIEGTSFFIAAEEEMPNFIPVTDLNSVLQFLASDSTDVIILTLPEDRSFSRTGEPAIIRAADYHPHRRQP
jgi:anti-sigma factor RsiW